METKVLTAHVPLDLAEQVDAYAARLERSRGWIVKQALADWIAWEEEKNRLTLEAIEDADKNGTIPHEEVVAYFEDLIAGGEPDRPKPRKS
jgi:predicted transcriptional regulator